MMSRKRWTLSAASILSAAMITGIAPAQTQSQAPVADVGVTYDALHANTITAQNFWMQGGALEMGVRLHGGLGAAARLEGLHAGAGTAQGAPLSLITTVFGPRYTWTANGGRIAIFGEGLAGAAYGFDGLFSVGSGPLGSVNVGTRSSAQSLAAEVGGGLDVGLTSRLAIRAIRVGYLRTNLPNSTTNAQNNLSIGAGIVLRFGF